MDAQPRIFHIIYTIELFIASRGLGSHDPESFISSTTLSYFKHQGLELMTRSSSLIRSQLVSQLIHVQLVSLDFGPHGVINKIYNLLHHELG